MKLLNKIISKEKQLWKTAKELDMTVEEYLNMKAKH